MTDEGESLRSWKAELRELESRHLEDRSNLSLALSYWKMLEIRPEEAKWKTVELAVRTFGGAALDSKLGVDALADSLMEVFDLTGRVPRSEHFGVDLRAAIELAASQRATANMEWLLACIK